MGCGPSKEDAEGGAASRCRERKHLIKAAVRARHALAGAHAGHAAALRNVGAALSDYATGETDRHDAHVVPRSASAAAALGGGNAVAAAAALKALPPPPLDAVLPPPPPPEGEGEGDHAPLQRSLSAPDIPLQQNIRKGRSGEAPIIEEEGEADAAEDDAPRRREDDDPHLQPPPPPPPPPANPPPPTRSPPPVPAPDADRKPAPQEGNFLNDYLFGSHHEDMPMPPPTLDPDASAAAESSWAAERREPAPPEDVAEGKKPVVAELVTRRAAAQKVSRKAEGKKVRVAMAPQPVRLGDVLHRLDERFLEASQGAHEVSKMLEAARMHYHSNFADTRGVRGYQSDISTKTSCSKQKEATWLWHMWDVMYAQHKAQLRIITELKASDISVAARETSEQHHERTLQLWSIVQEWHTQFGKFMTCQKEYVGSLYAWIKLNVIPIDTNLKPNSSQPHETTPPIKRLLHAWHDILEKLPDDATKKAIHMFAEVVNTILVQQEDELKLRIKIEETRRDLDKKRKQFDDWAQKNWDRGASIPDGDNPGRADPAAERKAVVDRVENALKDLEDQYKTQCRVVRDKSLNLLRSNLPELFRVVSEFSLHCAKGEKMASSGSFGAMAVVMRNIGIGALYNVGK
ncbi:hypothetical protein BAE44_0012419 [Dichanthelium oligosanthes]|uniref:DUF632 domain-containing protein n=1 Tax=Dichanthelium oligosanthes TaxID=888268 RepID=A0A1E5VNA9_9POAL|nr:hypothetical protein BAE44_0012419 [Dichanthelium oligosanthes]